MNFARVRLWRRLVAATIDMLIPGLTAFIAGTLVATESYTPPGGWFWSEWLLKIWLDHPIHLLAPAGIFVAVWLMVGFVTEGLFSATPGSRIMGLELVTGRGRAIGWNVALLRLVGGLLNVALLGFGSAWAIADPEARTLQDRLAGTWLVSRKSARRSGPQGGLSSQ